MKKLIFLFIAFLIMSCDFNDINNESVIVEDNLEQRKLYRELIFNNRHILRSELPLLGESKEMYDMVRFNYEQFNYGHTYTIINIGGELIPTYKCQIDNQFCSFGFAHQNNSSPMRKWSTLLEVIKNENGRHDAEKPNQISVETLLDGDYSKIYVNPSSREDNIWKILKKIRQICLPEMSKDSIDKELIMEGCPCEFKK